MYWEQFGDKDAGVIDERVDAPEPSKAFDDRPFGRLAFGDIAGQRKDFMVVRRFDRTRRRDHPVMAIAVCIDEGRANALRRTSNHSNLQFDAHGKPP